MWVNQLVLQVVVGLVEKIEKIGKTVKLFREQNNGLSSKVIESQILRSLKLLLNQARIEPKTATRFMLKTLPLQIKEPTRLVKLLVRNAFSLSSFLSSLAILIVFLPLKSFSKDASQSDISAQDPVPIMQGKWIQGGLLYGSIDPGSQVKFLDNEVYVDPAGQFILGLGRDTKNEVELHVISPKGHAKTFVYEVEQREYRVQRIEGVAKKYVSPPAEVTKRIKADSAAVWKARQTRRKEAEFRENFIWPAKGPITGVYGSQRVFNGVPKRPHYGLDIAGPVGASIYAPASGKVTLVHNDMYYSGGTLVVDHGQALSSTFIHLSKILVKEGDYVKQGDVIAEMGATGRVTGPHLDWRINWMNQRLDPFLLLPPRPKE